MEYDGVSLKIAFKFSWIVALVRYRHSSIYAVKVGTHKQNSESKNSVNRDYLGVLKLGEVIRIELLTAVNQKLWKLKPPKSRNACTRDCEY